MLRLRTLSIITALAVMTSARSAVASAPAPTFYVAPDGSNHWRGDLPRPNAARTDGPLASLDGARDAVRGVNHTGSVAVIVENGIYPLVSTFVLEPKDSGLPGRPVVYEAAPGAHPIFTGGRSIKGWKRGSKGVWTAVIPDVAAGRWYFEQLWVNGTRATRARTPNHGFLYAVDHATAASDPQHGDPATIDSRAFRARPSDIAPLLALSPQELNDVNLVAFHSWESSRNRIAGIDGPTGTVAVTHPVDWSFFNWGRPRYILENYRAALDSPGEWFLDRKGILSYIPLPGQDMSKAMVIAPVTEQFIQIQGDMADKAPVHDILFKGLTFEYSQYLLPESGHADGQAEFSIPAVIMADGAQNIMFDHCEVAHTGIYGIWFREACKSDSVTHSYLHDLGAGGIRIGEGSIRSDVDLQTSHVTVNNDIILGADRIHNGAIGVWIGQSGDNQITHNDIGDLYYTGISAGWTWGYGASLARNNIISYNHIHNIGQGMLNDMGGIYTLGISDGTIVRGNHIHDVYTYSGLGWGLYNDEGSSNILLDNNLVHDTRSGGYHQHYGQDNVVQNNIFAFGQDAQLQRTRVEDRHALSFVNNIVYWSGGPTFTGDWQKNITVKSNVYWDTVNDAAPFRGMSFKNWQATGQDAGSILADPLFENPKARDFRLRHGSPAIKIGFKPFDSSLAGVYGDRSWIALARNAPMPVFVAPPPEPYIPLQVSEDFEAIPVGSRPSGPTYNVENLGDSISVTNETAATGTHSLKFEDAPGLKNTFDPHMYYSPDHREGVTRCTFDLRMEPGAIMYHEWRDSAAPYNVGPSFTISDGKLTANNVILADIPNDVWVHITISARLGKMSNGTWDLTVAVPGDPPGVFFGLKNGDARWKTLNWLGFVSNATTKTDFYLDNLNLTNSPR